MKQSNLHTIKRIEKELEEFAVKTELKGDRVVFSKSEKSVSFFIADATFDFQKTKELASIPLDQLVREPAKVAAMVRSKLQLNTVIFARNCVVKRVDKKEAEDFLNRYHLMNATQSAYNLGLYYKEELVALASFSKGRKMNRLEEHQRSFELIRFCCKSGITVTGGLTRLIKNFCIEKNAGDVMTYVDKQLSDGRSFINAGFKKHSETEPNYFLVNSSTFERAPANRNDRFDDTHFYLSCNSGNIKLVYTPKLK